MATRSRLDTSLSDNGSKSKNKLFCKTCFSKYCKELKGRNLNIPSWLLVLYSIAIGASIEVTHSILYGLMTKVDPDSCWYPFPSNQPKVSIVLPYIHSFLHTVLFVVMGWLADTKIGRERSINLSLWSCWLAIVLQVISYCIQYGTCGLPVNIAKYRISGVALLLILIGSSSLFATVLAYGMDQMIDESNAQIRAFVHWVVWGIFMGFLFGYIAFVKNTIYDAKLLLVTGMIVFLFISFTLLAHTYFIKHFRPSGILLRNPYTTVHNVLMYAYRHKHPENRSAFTYWETKLPSRIDLGKGKYGGPFTEGEVEDVKIFLRIVAIYASLFGFYVPFVLYKKSLL